MGLSSSQARLLHLTGRMHQIEYKAQRLEAQKLQLANESNHVYEEYENALDATKIQYGAISADGSVTYVDATLNALENGVVSGYDGETSNETYLLYDGANNVVKVTQQFADAYGITDGQKTEDPGDLDSWLDAHNCHKEEIKVTETDYNNVKSATPVDNRIVKAPSTITVQDADTYSLNGHITTPVPHTTGATYSYTQNGSTPSVSATDPVKHDYNVTAQGTAPTVSITDPEMNGTHKVITTGTTPASAVDDSNKTDDVTKTIYTLPKDPQYNKYISETWTFTPAEINSKLSDILPDLNYDDGDVAVYNRSPIIYANTIHFYYDESNFNNNLSLYTSSGQVRYDKNTTLKEVLQHMNDNSKGYLKYDGANTLTSTTGGFHTISNDDAFLDYKFTQWLFSHEKINKESSSLTWNLDTNIKEYNNAILNSRPTDLGHTTCKVGIYHTDNSGKSVNEDTSYKGSKDPNTLTFREYFDDLKANIPGFDYQVVNGQVQLIMNGDYSIGFSNLSGTTTKEKNTTTDVNINRKAIAENIYLAQSMVNETSEDDYNNNHSSNVNNILNNLKANYTTDEKKGVLATFAKELETAIKSNKTADINNLLAAYSNGSYNTNNYQNRTEKGTTYKYNINFNDSDVTVTPNTKDQPDGTISKKGDINVNSSEEELREALAKKLYDANTSSTYEAYLANLAKYNTREMAALYNNFGTYQADLIANNDLKSALAKYNDNAQYTLNQNDNVDYNVTTTGAHTDNGKLTFNCTDEEMREYLAYQDWNKDANKTSTSIDTFKSKYASYDSYQLANAYNHTTKYNSSDYDVVEPRTSANYSLNSSSSTPATKSVTVSAADDVLDQLAYDIYQKQGSGNPNTIKSQLTGKFTNRQLASLSSYYGTSDWNTIVNNLANNMNASAVATYTNALSAYTDSEIIYSSDSVRISTQSNSHPQAVKGDMQVPNINGIASNLVIAFRKAGHEVDEAELKTLLENQYGNDNDANNFNLANINRVICDYINGKNNNTTSVENIYNNIYNNGSLNVATTYSSSNYNISRKDLGTANAEYGTHEVGTGKYKWVHDDEYEKWYNEWEKAKSIAGYTFEIVSAELSADPQFVSNWLTQSGAHLLKFGKEDSTSSINKLVATNVSVETKLREVSNEKNLKKAEAQYEADMKRIDQKDKKYDTDLAALETERNATKQEMETLKTVAKDNVDRTFKLFS